MAGSKPVWISTEQTSSDRLGHCPSAAAAAAAATSTDYTPRA